MSVDVFYLTGERDGPIVAAAQASIIDDDRTSEGAVNSIAAGMIGHDRCACADRPTGNNGDTSNE